MRINMSREKRVEIPFPAEDVQQLAAAAEALGFEGVDEVATAIVLRAVLRGHGHQVDWADLKALVRRYERDLADHPNRTFRDFLDTLP